MRVWDVHIRACCVNMRVWVWPPLDDVHTLVISY